MDKVFLDARLLSPLVPVESLSLLLVGLLERDRKSNPPPPRPESFSSFASLFSRTFHGFFTGWICEINAKGFRKGSNFHIVAMCRINITHAGLVFGELLNRHFIYRLSTKSLLELFPPFLYLFYLLCSFSAIIVMQFTSVKPLFGGSFSKTIIRPHIKNMRGLTGVVFLLGVGSRSSGTRSLTTSVFTNATESD